MVPGFVVSYYHMLKSLDSGEPWINFKKKIIVKLKKILYIDYQRNEQ